MGRRKLEIKLIENKSSRQVTFSKRRNGLIEKARQLSVLCESSVAVLVVSASGKLYNSSSGDKIGEESVNHVLFECPVAFQAWVLSQVLSCPGVFPTQALFTNIDYLFWRLPKTHDFSYFPWILWYIWKSQNEKIYRNKNGNPLEIIRMGEVEGKLWTETQIDPSFSIVSGLNEAQIPFSENWCFIDGAWKEEDLYTEQGWFYKSYETQDTMMGSMNIRRSLSPLYAECEALIWAMECMKTLRITDVKFATDCSQLVKMVSTPAEWPAFITHMEEFNRCKTYFDYFSIQHIPRAHNHMADKLARGAMMQPLTMVYVNSVLPRWFSD